MAGLFALFIGFISLRRSGIYFSILTLAFAQMSYASPIRCSPRSPTCERDFRCVPSADNPETSLLDGDIRIIDQAIGIQEIGIPITNLFGMKMSGYEGFYFCAVC
jgi:hypothetical protein